MKAKEDKVVIFIKPKFLLFKKQIIQIFKKVFKTVEVFQTQCSQEFIQKLYSEHRNTWFYEKLMSYYKKQSICIIFLYGDNRAMEQVRKIVGHKDPSVAEKGSIRNRFSQDSLEKANQDLRIVDNVVHFQEDREKMIYEVELFEEFLS